MKEFYYRCLVSFVAVFLALLYPNPVVATSATLPSVTLLSVPTKTAPKITMGLQPLGKVSPRIVALVQRGLAAMYNAKVEVLPARAPPRDSWQRGTQRVERLLPWLDASTARGYAKVVGLTASPLSVERGNTIYKGVSGYGLLNRRPCVISTALLGRPGTATAVFYRRLVKVANHEVGHTLGLDHCPANGCLMADMRGTMKFLDRRSGAFCNHCRRRLAGALANALAGNLSSAPNLSRMVSKK